MKRILAETINGHEVEITGITQPGTVEVTALHNHEPFYDYNPYPTRSRFGVVAIDSLQNIRVEDDPFQPDDSQPEIEEDIPDWLDEQRMYWDLRHGG